MLLVFVLSGVLEPPIQTVPVHNTSAVDVRYWVDTEALTALAKENYGFQILKCLNPDVRERSVQLALPHALVVCVSVVTASRAKHGMLLICGGAPARCLTGPDPCG